MIYILLPLYREADKTKALVSELRDIFSNKSYKIIAVNDGVNPVITVLESELKKGDIIFCSYEISLGMGNIISNGFYEVFSDSKSDNDIIITLEGSRTYSKQLLIDFVSELECGADIVLASRYRFPGAFANFPFLRTLFSRVLNRLLALDFPIRGVKDYTIFLRAYRMKVVKEAYKYFGRFGFIQSRGFVSNVELLVKLSLFTKEIKELAFKYDLKNNAKRYRINVLGTINEYLVLASYLRRIFKKVDRIRKEGT